MLRATTRADVTILLRLTRSFLLSYFETNFAVVKGIPLAISVIKIPRIDDAIWYNPIPSAPSFLDKKILKTKPRVLVKTEKIVTIATALKIDFITCPYLIYKLTKCIMTI